MGIVNLAGSIMARNYPPVKEPRVNKNLAHNWTSKIRNEDYL